jgi:hypothetical protein
MVSYSDAQEQLEGLDSPPVQIEAISGTIVIHSCHYSTGFLFYPPDVFEGAMAKNLIQKDVEQVVPIVLARAGYEMRSIDLGKSGEIVCTIEVG